MSVNSFRLTISTIIMAIRIFKKKREEEELEQMRRKNEAHKAYCKMTRHFYVPPYPGAAKKKTGGPSL